MTLDLETRRPVRLISRADFAAYPVWEWAINEEESLGQGESILRPTSLDSVPLGMPGHFVVGATATLSDGSVLPACVEVHVRTNTAQLAPMFILMPDRHLDFAGQATITVLTHYTKVNGTRPVSWELAVPLAGKTVPPRGKVRESLRLRAIRLVRRLGMPVRLPGSPSSHVL
ncbi:hypothetical protein KY495_06465 [Massilia sp. PAMC28688]|uniref:hypothetical protein n=1 Tax=Massilia sp. PAMC28688 TaxID=2861283 RepID=UPI001C62F934|nr:hypothetical protein [Massilia sp. PAMC28688]QYF94824.1 hypothetical protein KY495_06465 [Massilia sp. PAMC28688]